MTGPEKRPMEKPSEAGPRPGEARPPSPIHSEQEFDSFYTSALEPTILWTLARFPNIAKDRGTAEQVVGDAFEATFRRRHEVRTNPVAFLHDRIYEAIDAYASKSRVGSLEALDAGGTLPDRRGSGRAPDSQAA